MDILKTVGLFVLTAIAEIVGPARDRARCDALFRQLLRGRLRLGRARHEGRSEKFLAAVQFGIRQGDRNGALYVCGGGHTSGQLGGEAVRA